MRIHVRALLLFLWCLIFSMPVHAQFETGSVVGTVHDTTGAVVPDATITLTNVATGVAVTRKSGPAGEYEFVNAKDGAYVVTAEKAGFSVMLVDNVQVQVGARLRLDLQMAVGQVAEQVQVTAAAPLLETDSSQRGHVVTGDVLRELALNGREYSALALMAPGVRQSALNKSTSGTPREGAFNVNGLRSTFNNFLIDGVDNNAAGTQADPDFRGHHVRVQRREVALQRTADQVRVAAARCDRHELIDALGIEGQRRRRTRESER